MHRHVSALSGSVSLGTLRLSTAMPSAPRMPRWMPALRNRRGAPNRQYHAGDAVQSSAVNSTLPPRLRKRDILLRGPQLLLRGPGLLLQAPKVVWKAPAAARAGTRRLLSNTTLRSRQQNPQQRPQGIEELSQPRAETLKSAGEASRAEDAEQARQSFAGARPSPARGARYVLNTFAPGNSSLAPEMEGNANKVVADPRLTRCRGPCRLDPVQAGVRQGQGACARRRRSGSRPMAGAFRELLNSGRNSA